MTGLDAGQHRPEQVGKLLVSRYLVFAAYTSADGEQEIGLRDIDGPFLFLDVLDEAASCVGLYWVEHGLCRGLAPFRRSAVP